MLDGTDKATFYALRLLRDVVEQKRKPLVLWAGAGVSKWCNYPLWREVAEEFHSEYGKYEAAYDKTRGQTLLQTRQYPELFDICRDTNKTRYYRKLEATFRTKPRTAVYSHFLAVLRRISPTYILTTNIDENLEHSLSSCNAVQGSNLERVLELLDDRSSFVAKLHGSVSAIESTVFTAADYQALIGNHAYVDLLQSIFLRAIVVFLGYSLSDQYLVQLLQRNVDLRQLFGDGPHFLVASGEATGLPKSIQVIRYLPEPYGDHRSSITALDVIRVSQSGDILFSVDHAQPVIDSPMQSAYFISDITPAGTWTSSQTLNFARAGMEASGIVGQGFDDSELPDRIPTALHDLTVGLTAFDVVHVPLSYVGRLHDLLGQNLFWPLIQEGVFRFVYLKNEPIIMFSTSDAISGGDIGMIGRSSASGGFLSVDDEIRRQIKAAPGHEAEAERLFETLRGHVSIYDDPEVNIPRMARGALLHPSVQKLLGISSAVFPTNIPRYVALPVIRLVHMIMIGCTCSRFSLPATKIGFGGEVLAGAAFAIAAARDWADSVASYALTSRFNTDLAKFIESTPGAFKAIMKFRDSQPGIDLRREILHELATHSGAEFVASVNAGLRNVIPTDVMTRARDQLSGLLFENKSEYPVVPAIWTKTRNSDQITRLWRARSRRLLTECCEKNKISQYDPCPCDSGEKLRFCCEAALRE